MKHYLSMKEQRLEFKIEEAKENIRFWVKEKVRLQKELRDEWAKFG